MSELDHQKTRLRELLKEKNAIMLAHNYQRDEIQEIADLTGDSLALSMEAAKTDADIIVFCGVHFMAESAAILSPQKRVLLPRMDAGCPMADMITPSQLKEAKASRPDYTVVTYVNSSAEVKAGSDICCTSANAVSVVNNLEGDKVFFTPDRNLAHWTSRHTEKTVEWWDGYCPTHEHLPIGDVKEAIEKYPGAKFMAHPECTPEILDLANAIRSTSGMLAYAQETDAKQFIVGTEMGLLYQLRKRNPDKEFILASKKLVCPNMKKIKLEHIIESLEIPEEFTISVPEEIRIKAKVALDRMILAPRDAG